MFYKHAAPTELTFTFCNLLQTYRSYGAGNDRLSALKGQNISAMGAARRGEAELSKPWKGAISSMFQATRIRKHKNISSTGIPLIPKLQFGNVNSLGRWDYN